MHRQTTDNGAHADFRIVDGEGEPSTGRVEGEPLGLADILRDRQAVENGLLIATTLADLMHKSATPGRWLQGFAAVAVIAAVVLLSLFEKLDPSAGVILGAVAGYLLRQDD